MQTILGQPITASLVDQPPGLVGLGARIEVPVTHAIVSAWQPATLAGALWTVELESPLTAGDYQFVWRTSDPEPPAFEAFVPLTVVPSAVVAGGTASVEDITPTVDDVGALLHARTLANGAEVGTFTVDTRPTAAQVERLIALAVSDLAGRIGAGVPAAYAGDAKELAALQAATLVEASFFPAQLDTDRSAYRQYQAMYINGVEALGGDARRPSALRLA